MGLLLRNTLQARDVIFNDVSEYERLAATIRSMQEVALPERAKAQVDLGCNFFCQATM